MVFFKEISLKKIISVPNETCSYKLSNTWENTKHIAWDCWHLWHVLNSYYKKYSLTWSDCCRPMWLHWLHNPHAPAPSSRTESFSALGLWSLSSWTWGIIIHLKHEFNKHVNCYSLKLLAWLFQNSSEGNSNFKICSSWSDHFLLMLLNKLYCLMKFKTRFYFKLLFS